ncbi:MAG: hypothetical protein KAG56_00695 [Sulfurovaceae bacterium]|nr:hypothetical protein [Sulfurovaceae bacterium]
MKILLINNNPVVSRLTALSARKENISLDEIKTISELKANDYNIIFVDGESYNNDVSNILRNSGVKRRVLFYTQGDDNEKSIFTQTILKPFLPSEVSEILRKTKVEMLKEKEVSKESVDFNNLVKENKENELEVLNIMEKEESKEKDIIEKITIKEDIIEEKSEPSTVPIIPLAVATATTTALLSEKEDKFDEKIKEAFPISLDEISDINEKEKKNDHKENMFDLDDNLFELNDKKETPKESIDSDLFEIDDKKDALNDKIGNDLFEIDKEIKKEILTDVPLDFDIESKDEVSFEPTIEKKVEPKIATKILDNNEISNIKDILNEKEGAESLTAVPASLMSIKEKSEEKIIEEVEEKSIENITDKKETSNKQETFFEEEINEEQSALKKKKKSEEKLSTGAAIAHTLSKLPVADLRKLLRGAKVNISIEFPNEA